MAQFGITINPGEFSISRPTITNGSCTTKVVFEIFSTNGNLINIAFSGGTVENEFYTSNGIQTFFTGSTNVSFNNSLIVEFELPNTGINGVFNEVTTTITDNTMAQPVNSYNFEVIRFDDSAPCNSGIIGDKNFTFSQNTPSALWTIQHDLNKFPSVSVIDTSGNIVLGSVNHIDVNNLTISFTAPFSGTATLN